MALVGYENVDDNYVIFPRLNRLAANILKFKYTKQLMGFNM